MGATGSIGESTFAVLDAHPDRFRVSAVTAGRNAARLVEICRQYKPKYAAIGDEAAYDAFRDAVAGLDIETGCGEAGVLAAAAYPADRVMAAITGLSGLKPTLAAIETGSKVMLANKECLVAAGALFMALADKHGSTILPVDSEHNALHQLLENKNAAPVRHLTLTASGGPFLDLPVGQLPDVTPKMAVKHPVWPMGEKISIDSATMMNKGLELIEAQHLFQVPAEKLRVLVHPQSIIHGLVTLHDGSVLAHLGTPDMQMPIAYCLGWPDRLCPEVPPLDLASQGELTFLEADTARYPCLEHAYAALKAGKGLPTVLNAANEVAVEAFREAQIGFTDIASIIGSVMEKMPDAGIATLDDVFEIDRAARRLAFESISL